MICAVLSWSAPTLGRPVLRLGIGAVVGIVAAAILPALKAAMGL
ncbi:hypothetical protein [Aliiroseovarius sp.]|nr:hypothetical protein [Aliiroseovarius sp.]